VFVASLWKEAARPVVARPYNSNLIRAMSAMFRDATDLFRREPPSAPIRPNFIPTSRGAMCEAQWIDFKAACDGKITWRQYFTTWGREGLTPTL